MKKLYIISGTMGVGKSTVGKLLTEKLPESVLLEGDWCWNYAVNNAETRQIAVDNACDLLNRYLKSQSYRNIVFCWVFPFQSVWEQFLSRLQTPCDIVKVCLTCQQNQLVNRLQRDVKQGLRLPDVVQRSIERQKQCLLTQTVKVDTTFLSPNQVVEVVLKM